MRLYDKRNKARAAKDHGKKFLSISQPLLLEESSIPIHPTGNSAQWNWSVALSLNLLPKKSLAKNSSLVATDIICAPALY